MMYTIDTHPMSEAFFECWVAAGEHLNMQVQGGIQYWLRAHPYPPFLEHLSFRLGNQLFFVRIEDAEGMVEGPGNPRGVCSVAQGMNGHACLMPMRKALDGQWRATEPSWGLLDAETGKPVDPVALVTDEKIEMTPWELQDVAVQVVRENLERQGIEVLSWQGNPNLDPSLWIAGDTGPEWVAVRASVYPNDLPVRPDNWEEIGATCAHKPGHFAPVVLCGGEQPFQSDTEEVIPLWRGYQLHARFRGLE